MKEEKPVDLSSIGNLAAPWLALLFLVLVAVWWYRLIRDFCKAWKKTFSK